MKFERKLEMRIITYPLKAKEELFRRSYFEELKNYLEKETQIGPVIDSINKANMFKALEIGREGFSSFSNRELVGSIMIKKSGFIIYNWHFSGTGMKKPLIQLYYMSTYFLGYLNLIFKFYRKIDYDGEFILIFTVTSS
ncbi:MAG: hypothetical protein ACFFAN_10775 [Promethearchaeota archaeon]